jgi:hypothetical protein
MRVMTKQIAVYSIGPRSFFRCSLAGATPPKIVSRGECDSPGKGA